MSAVARAAGSYRDIAKSCTVCRVCLCVCSEEIKKKKKREKYTRQGAPAGVTIGGEW